MVFRLSLLVLSLVLVVLGSRDGSVDPVRLTAAQRDALLRQAIAWEAPPWLDPQTFAFSGNPIDDLLPHVPVFPCTYQERSTPGASPKFFCRGDFGWGERTWMLKYGLENGEVFGEAASSALLRALGFRADPVFAILSLDCPTCPARIRNSVLIAKEWWGTELAEYRDQGWEWEELDMVSADPSAAARQRLHREALRLLMVFIGHGDNRGKQQRLACAPGGWQAETGACDRPYMFPYDLGATFGAGTTNKLFRVGIGSDSKMTLDAFRERRLWRTPALTNGTREAFFEAAGNGSTAIHHPRIPEGARIFLSRLLTGFAAGDAGRARVRGLFERSRVHLRGDSVDAWIAAFDDKVDELARPDRH